MKTSNLSLAACLVCLLIGIGAGRLFKESEATAQMPNNPSFDASVAFITASSDGSRVYLWSTSPDADPRRLTRVPHCLGFVDAPQK